MTKVYDYPDEPRRQLEKIARHGERQSAPSGWLLAITAISIGLAIFAFCLAVVVVYQRYSG